MAYGRYDNNRGWRETRSRYDERNDRGRQDDHERGFFERAGDEVASWFGDEDAERRRERDERRDDSYGRRPYNVSTPDWGRSDWNRSDYDRSDYDRSDYGRSDYSRPMSNRSDYGRYDQPRFRDEGYRRPYTGRFTNRSQGETGYRDRDERWDRSPRDDRYDRGSTQREYFTGQASGLHDPHYSQWRRRQIDSLDRDYDEYRRENESRFDNEFSQWREQRASKRQMLGDIKEHMSVVGSDGENVGTVDKVRGDRIVLTKSDSDDGKHHVINCSMIDCIDGDTVKLDCPAEEAKSKAKTLSDNDRAFFDRDENRDEGPHMLNRSFSGTY